MNFTVGAPNYYANLKSFLKSGIWTLTLTSSHTKIFTNETQTQEEENDQLCGVFRMSATRLSRYLGGRNSLITLLKKKNLSPNLRPFSI